MHVFAAASLRGAFEAMARDFEAAHPHLQVQFHFAGTQTLALQLRQGAPADVFVSADETTALSLADAGLLNAPVAFAQNEPVWVVSATARDKIRRVEDLPAAPRIVLAAREVPIGRYAQAILESYPEAFRRQVYEKVVSYELDVKHVLARVQLGEADVGLVYRTDVDPSSSLAVLPIPPEHQVRARYFLGVVSHSLASSNAQTFVQWVLSARGQAALQRFGFQPAKGAP